MLDEPLYWCLKSLGTNYVSLCYPLGDALCEKLKKKHLKNYVLGNSPIQSTMHPNWHLPV